MSSQPLELEARILWKTGRLFKFLKWPSAHEVNFGTFVVEFDFKNGQLWARYPDGRNLEIGTFTPQKRGTSITSIVGPIRIAGDYLVELQPATEQQSAAISCKNHASDELLAQFKMDDGEGEWRVAERISLIPVIEGRDAFLKILYTEKDLELAVVLASLTVFLRFSV